MDTIFLWSKNAKPHIDFESLVDQGVKEIIVPDAEVDYGTGIFETDMTIWKAFGDCYLSCSWSWARLRAIPLTARHPSSQWLGGWLSHAEVHRKGVSLPARLKRDANQFTKA
jgi:hypothetical protein